MTNLSLSLTCARDQTCHDNIDILKTDDDDDDDDQKDVDEDDDETYQPGEGKNKRRTNVEGNVVSG